MKYRRIFALLLALALLCALTVPALAAGTTYEDFLADFDRWWAESYPGMTVEEFGQDYMQGMYPTEEELMQALYELWRFELWQQDYFASHPGVWEELRSNAYSYFDSHPYYGTLYDSAQDYMEQFGLIEDQFRDRMASMQLSRLYNDYAIQQMLDDFITEHGGVPGQLNVMVNGKCLSFPAQRPAYMQGGVTYVDAATLSQALGADVAAGENGYAPLRTAAEALGCDVYWDGIYGMPVVLDPAAVAAEIDKDFTLYNRVYSNGYAGNWTLTGTAKASLTLFDTMAGDKTAAGSGSADLVISKDGFSGTAKYDLSNLFKPLREILPQLAGLPEKDAVELRMDKQNNTLCVHAPALNDAMIENGADITRGTWLSQPLDELVLARFLPQNKTIGQQLYALFTDGTITLTSPAYQYDHIMDMAHSWAELWGDAQFTRNGNAYTLTPKLETGGSPIDDLYWLKVSQQSQTLTVRDNGDVDIDTRMRLSWDDLEYSLGDVAEFTCQSTRRGNRIEAVADLHVKNVFQLSVTLDMTAGTTDKAPELTPPEGAQVLPTIFKLAPAG